MGAVWPVRKELASECLIGKEIEIEKRIKSKQEIVRIRNETLGTKRKEQIESEEGNWSGQLEAELRRIREENYQETCSLLVQGGK